MVRKLGDAIDRILFGNKEQAFTHVKKRFR